MKQKKLTKLVFMEGKMMKTYKKNLILAIITFLLGFNFCYAVDLDMTDNETNNADLTTNTIMEDNNTNTNSNTNTSSTINNTNSTSSSISNSTFNTTNTTSLNSPTTVSNVNSTSNSSLGLSNILNILLIVIGILLVLLSIAILIRLKK